MSPDMNGQKMAEIMRKQKHGDFFGLFRPLPCFHGYNSVKKGRRRLKKFSYPYNSMRNRLMKKNIYVNFFHKTAFLGRLTNALLRTYRYVDFVRFFL